MSALSIVPVDHLQRIGVVVPRLEEAATAYAEVYGIDQWDVTTIGPDLLRASTAHGRPVEHGYRVARGANPAGTMSFELIEPGTGESSFREFLLTKGPGVHHLQLVSTDAAGYADVEGFFAAQGIGVAQGDDLDGLQRRFFDTRSGLGGYLIGVDVTADGAEGQLPVHERWDLGSSYERPPGVGPLETAGVQHFGVVVRDVMAGLSRYSELYGLHQWVMADWHSGPGSLEDPTYLGQPVDHAYFCGMAFGFHDFGFELIQPTFGPSHYKEDFLHLRGEGVHHMNLVFLSSDEQWQQLQSWMLGMGVPVVMSGGLRNNVAYFHYLDTREKLGGYVVECFGVTPDFDPAAMTPDFVVDLTPVGTAR